ncbi:MAG: hypothetical protein IPN96_10195 [Anaerolineales bacterium]|nr:hypothetical protein [Anaerolineales bacterium]
MIFWGVTFVLGIGVFIVARNFTDCWSITDLPGRPLSTCKGLDSTDTAFAPEDGTPVPDLPPTPQASVPEPELPPALGRCQPY